MSLIPTWPIAAGTLVFGLVAGAGAVHVWDAKEIAALNVTIAKMKQTAAEDVSKQYQSAFSNLEAATASVRDAAMDGHISVSALGNKLDAINRNLKNAKPTPLPTDCKLDAIRLRNLSESAAAVDTTIKAK